jgi:hypothetical protein
MAGSVESTVQNIPIVGSPEERLQKVLKMIEDLTRQGFYGKLTVNYEGGKITYGRKEETIRF